MIAIISGKRLERQLRRRPFHQAHNNESEHIIEGEFEEVPHREQNSEQRSDYRQ
ncbi:hypothetical protein VIB_002750 [Vibrio metschnikovii CIP 69.14]|nr:hypothetical protein VIB_002750 [Vibrio metschnikovii CIP 69.14]